MHSWECPLCRRTIYGTNSKAAHYRNLWKHASDRTRCDNVAIVTETPPAPPAPMPALLPIIVAPVSNGLYELARRRPTTATEMRAQRQVYIVPPFTGRRPGHARDMVSLQDAWDDFKASVRETCSPKFWTFFLAMHTCSAAAIDSALGTARRLFLRPNSHEWKMWPPTKRALYTKIYKLESFWPKVMHTVQINLKAFTLPSGTTQLEFKFVDPLWAWICAARRMDPLDLQWQPVHMGAEPLYGGGIQFGQAFLEAVKSCGPDAFPMCFSLHWDGTSAHGVHAAPICIGVSNTNRQTADSHFCVGYTPVTPDAKQIASTVATNLKHYIRQQCSAAILRVMESAAVGGVMCRLRNREGTETLRLLYPRLMAMNFDQPEAQLSFSMVNRHSCSKCRWRKGHSAFRRGSRQKGTVVKRLYAIANDTHVETTAIKNAARKKLTHWGFAYQRPCALHSVCDLVLVRRRSVDEVYPCVDFRDVMHALKIFLHRVIVLDTLAEIKLSEIIKRVLMQRLHLISNRQAFRGRDGKNYRAYKQLFSAADMSAEDKVHIIFLLPHVLGHNGEILPPETREPMLTAIAQAQLLLIAVTGHRTYTRHELRIVFDDGWRLLFGCLERVHAVIHQHNVAIARAKNEPDPPPPRKRTRCMHFHVPN